MMRYVFSFCSFYGSIDEIFMISYGMEEEFCWLYVRKERVGDKVFCGGCFFFAFEMWE